MIHEYSQMVPVSEAIQMTFSGQYPCKMCKVIAEKKNSEQQKALSLEKYDKKFLPLPAIELVAVSSSPTTFPSFISYLQSRSDCPPTPPPRSLLS
jgi:hypothetical protein